MSVLFSRRVVSGGHWIEVHNQEFSTSHVNTKEDWSEVLDLTRSFVLRTFGPRQEGEVDCYFHMRDGLPNYVWRQEDAS